MDIELWRHIRVGWKLKWTRSPITHLSKVVCIVNTSLQASRIEEPCWPPMKWLLGSSQGWWWFGGSVLSRSKLQRVKNYNTVYFSPMENTTSIKQQGNPNRLLTGWLPLTRALSQGAVGHWVSLCLLFHALSESASDVCLNECSVLLRML